MARRAYATSTVIRQPYIFRLEELLFLAAHLMGKLQALRIAARWEVVKIIEGLLVRYCSEYNMEVDLKRC